MDSPRKTPAHPHHSLTGAVRRSVRNVARTFGTKRTCAQPEAATRSCVIEAKTIPSRRRDAPVFMPRGATVVGVRSGWIRLLRRDDAHGRHQHHSNKPTHRCFAVAGPPPCQSIHALLQGQRESLELYIWGKLLAAYIMLYLESFY